MLAAVATLVASYADALPAASARSQLQSRDLDCVGMNAFDFFRNVSSHAVLVQALAETHSFAFQTACLYMPPRHDWAAREARGSTGQYQATVEPGPQLQQDPENAPCDPIESHGAFALELDSKASRCSRCIPPTRQSFVGGCSPSSQMHSVPGVDDDVHVSNDGHWPLLLTVLVGLWSWSFTALLSSSRPH
jgi:hypothetical protein